MFDFILHALIIATIFGIASLSLNLQAGMAGLMNFGQVAFWGLGGYGVAFAGAAGLSPWIGLAGGMAAGTLLGAAVGALGRNLDAEYWAIATLGIAEITRLILLNESGAGGLGGDLSLVPSVSGRGALLQMLGLSVLMLVLCYAFLRRLTENQLGRELRLMREQPELSVSFGLDTVFAKIRAMAVGGTIAALAGGLSASYISYISPAELMPATTFLIWTMIIIGGVGNHRGAILGAFIVETIFLGAMFAKDALSIPTETIGALRTLLIGAVLLGFLLLRPEGAIPEKPRKFNA